MQTDLVGPIDFKTLMETGRTEHFTDEGMLGAVHAFLDEVFDGRDMLLRSTLNVLHERELKQGTKTTRGPDRVRADDHQPLPGGGPRELARRCSPSSTASRSCPSCRRASPTGERWPGAPPPGRRASEPPALETRLPSRTSTCCRPRSAVVSSAIHLRRAGGADPAFDAALAGARRANPTFVPSRYLSTRAAVRMGELLRAVCFYDCFGIPRGRWRSRRRILAELRLAMTLSGPDLGQTARAAQRETDPRERRQLAIVRAEREIFDRCLAALDLRPAPTEPPALDSRLLKATEPGALLEVSTDYLAGLAWTPHGPRSQTRRPHGGRGPGAAGGDGGSAGQQGAG